MTEETGLSLHDALLWKKCAAVSATEFVESLHFWEQIDEKQAFYRLCELIVCGLPLHDKTKVSVENNDSGLVDSGLAISTVMSKMLNVPPVEIDGEQPPDFENLQVIREEAFKVFAMLGVDTIYPWPYPLGMKYVRDLIIESVRKIGEPEEPEEPEELFNETGAGRETTNEERKLQSTSFQSKDAQRLPLVIAIAKDIGINPLDIPRGGKIKLYEEVNSRYPDISDNIFKQIWKLGKREGKLKMRNP